MDGIPKWLRQAYEASFSFNNPGCHYWWLGLTGALLLLFIIWRLNTTRQRFTVFQDENGVTETTKNALRDLVRIACDGVATASPPKIQFGIQGDRINVRIRAKLYQGQRLNEVRDQMRRRVTHTLQDTHGVQVGDVSFTVTGFQKGGAEDEPAAEEKK